MPDVIVVGARCAGAATAMLLARAGVDVLLVDKARFPSDTPRGHFVRGHGVRRLARWGLLDVLDAPPITTMRTDLGDGVLEGTRIEDDGVPVAIGPRRTSLDAALVRAAAAAGAEVRERFAVEALVHDGDRVTGVRGRSLPGGPVVEERAGLVVGADGRSSIVARLAGAEAEVDRPTATVWWWSYFGGVDEPGIDIRVADRRAVFAFPTDGGLHAVFAAYPLEELAERRRDPEGAIRAAAAPVAALGALAEAPREDRIFGATQLPNFVRRAHGPGWALAGDAACHKDPMLALGLRDALRDAEWLSEAVLSGDWAGYEARRATARPEFERNWGAAQLRGVPPELLEARAAVRGDAEATRRFFAVTQDLVEPQPA
jgi:flavin-dependent dehydrogenase